jgi:hypothetical protein
MLRKFDLVAKEENNALDRLRSAVDVVPEKKVAYFTRIA